MNESIYVTIRIKRKTRDKLVILGGKGQTYDDVITEMIHRFDGPDSDRTKFNLTSQAIRKIISEASDD